MVIFNVEIKKLIKLMKENPDLEVVVRCEAIDVEIETDYFEMQIDCCYVDNRAIYCGIIYYYENDFNDLIDDIIEYEGISKVAAFKRANKLMETVIVIQSGYKL